MSRQERVLPFAERVRAAVVRALAWKPMAFSDLVGATFNCDPAIVYSVLREEVSRRNIVMLDDAVGRRYCSATVASSEVTHRKRPAKRRVVNGTAKPTSTFDRDSLVPKWLASLPPAAPVFSQWWFAPHVYPGLIELLTACRPGPQRAALLGSPTLGALFSQVTSAHTTVLDVDTEILNSLSSQFAPNTDVITYDAAARLASDLVGAFDLVFSDPPWSRSSLRMFVQRASELARDDATVIVSVPQALTRPGLHDELADLMNLATRSGLRLQGRIPAATEYVIPEFERRAYLNVGLELTTPWRKGDLLLFRKSALDQGRQDTCDSYVRSSWWQMRVGNERVFLRPTDDRDGRTPAILPVPGNSGFVSSTTSSRNRGAQEASIVTTHNEIGIVHNYREVRDRLILAKVRANGPVRELGWRNGQLSLMSAVAQLVKG